jgi:ABC-type multidrug transport system fused ATPase/permease subunit
VKEEDEGQSDCATYWSLLTSGYKAAIPLMLINYPITTVLVLAVPYWLAIWASQEGKELENSYYVEVLGYIVLGLYVSGFSQNIITGQSAMQASKNFHRRGLASVVRSPVRFYDEHSVGSVLSRFSKDLTITDELLPWFWIDYLQAVSVVLASFIGMFAGNVFLLIVFIPFVIAIVCIYRRGTAHIKALTARKLQSTGPIYAQLSNSISGLFSVRAYKLEKHFTKVFGKCLELNSELLVGYQGSMRWMQLRNDLSAAVFIAFNCLLAVGLQDILDRTVLALGLAVVIITSMNLTWALQQHTEVGNMMCSAQRLLDYSKLPPEAAICTESVLQVTEGSIEFRDVRLSYTEQSIGLQGVSAFARGGSTVGIVGMTGSGKSSLIVALFRLVEVSQGHIFIDGQDTRQLGLHSLRSQIAIIPQSPFIFSASVRYNLDPFHKFSDEQLWHVLEMTELRSLVEHYDGQLEEELTPSKLSAGEKQLVCLGRALLGTARILVMDEATANVDMKTDKLIQRTIKKKFRGCTVLTIAHRLDTIIQYDEVWVMAEGLVRETGSPLALASNPSSLFYSLVENTGERKEALLEQIRS